MLPEKATFLEHLAECFAALPPEDVNLKAWMRRHALEMGIPYETFANHFCGENEPSARQMFVYCEHFGPSFEAQVRGSTYRGESIPVDELMAFIEQRRTGKIS